jgi:hypothetical protein
MEELVGVDPILAGHCREGVAGLLGFLENGALLLGSPAAPPLDRGDYFDWTHVGSILGGSHTTRLTPIT